MKQIKLGNWSRPELSIWTAIRSLNYSIRASISSGCTPIEVAIKHNLHFEVATNIFHNINMSL